MPHTSLTIPTLCMMSIIAVAFLIYWIYKKRPMHLINMALFAISVNIVLYLDGTIGDVAGRIMMGLLTFLMFYSLEREHAEGKSHSWKRNQ